MRTIVVSCGVMKHAIYASDMHDGIIVKDSSCDVTRMTIEAVRDYMVDDAKDNKPVGYSWKRDDGSTVKLILMIEGK